MSSISLEYMLKLRKELCSWSLSISGKNHTELGLEWIRTCQENVHQNLCLRQSQGYKVSIWPPANWKRINYSPVRKSIVWLILDAPETLKFGEGQRNWNKSVNFNRGCRHGKIEGSHLHTLLEKVKVRIFATDQTAGWPYGQMNTHHYIDSLEFSCVPKI